MEPTFKIILDRVHPKKYKTLPLRIRVYQGRKYKEQSLGISIPEFDWNEQLQTVHRTNSSYKAYNGVMYHALLLLGKPTSNEY